MKFTTISATLAAQPAVAPNHRVNEFDHETGVHRIYRGQVDRRPIPSGGRPAKKPSGDRFWRAVLIGVLFLAAVFFVVGVRW